MSLSNISRVGLAILFWLAPVFGFGFADDEPIELERGLVAHYPLDTDGRDIGGRGLHAINHGVRFEVDNQTTRGRAALFDGRSAYLTKPIETDSDRMLNFGRGDFSISVWAAVPDPAKLDDISGDIVSQYDTVKHQGFRLTLKTNSGVTFNQANDRQLQFGIDNDQKSSWVDRGKPGNALLAFAMASHEGTLFVGTCEPGKNERGRVYRLEGENRWVDCGSPDPSNAVTAFVVHRGKLHAGVGKYRVAGSSLPESENQALGGKIYAYEGGKTWTDLGRLPNAEAVGGLVVFRDQLYASSLYKPAGFFRHEGGTRWSDVGTPNGHRVEAITVWNGFLYATSYDDAKVFRFDGSTWTDCGKLGENTQTYSFAVYQGRLLVGTWPSGRVYQFEDLNKWTDFGHLGEELEVMGMLVHNGRLLAGTLPKAEIYSYEGGSRWDRLTTLDQTPNVRFRRAWTMAEHQGQVFCSTLPSGHIYSFESGKNVFANQTFPKGWNHVLAIKRANQLELYINGQSHGASKTFDSSLFPLNPNQPFFIGKGQNDFFLGKLANLKFYQRALNSNEIKQLAR